MIWIILIKLIQFVYKQVILYRHKAKAQLCSWTDKSFFFLIFLSFKKGYKNNTYELQNELKVYTQWQRDSHNALSYMCPNSRELVTCRALLKWDIGRFVRVGFFRPIFFHGFNREIYNLFTSKMNISAVFGVFMT